MYDKDEKKFKYPYDFSDQATMCIFDKPEYDKFYSVYENPIKQYSSWLEGYNIRTSILYNRLYELEQFYKFNTDQLSQLPEYQKISKDLDFLESRNKELRTEINVHVKHYHDLVTRKYNDQTVPDWFYPIGISVKDDLIVSSGLDIIGSQITNRTSSRWSYFHIGESGQGASMDQQALKAPIAAYPVSQIGSFTAVGDQIRFFGSIPSTLRNVDIREIGLSTKLLGGFLLNRSTYPQNDPLKHITNKTYPVATIVIYMTSDAAFSTKA